MTTIAGVDQGEFHHTYWCATCNAYWQEYMSNDDEIYEGELIHCDREAWEKLRHEIEDTPCEK